MKLTNKFNMPYPLFAAIQNDGYDGVNNFAEKQITVTTLIAPYKLSILKQRHWHELEEDASDKLWILLGQSIHTILERVNLTGASIEKRITKEVIGWKVSGKADLHYDYCLSDYKVTSVWNYIFSPNGKIEYEQQLNLLRYLFESDGMEVRKLEAIQIFRDWQLKAYTVAHKAGKVYPEKGFMVIPIKLWDIMDGDSREFIVERIRRIESLMTFDDDSIPECSQEDRWKNDGRCRNYCPVKNLCHYGRNVK